MQLLQYEKENYTVADPERMSEACKRLYMDPATEEFAAECQTDYYIKMNAPQKINL